MSAGVLCASGSTTTRGAPANSLHSSPESSCTAGSPTSPSPRRATLSSAKAQQPGGQGNHYGPLWFVQVTSNHDSTGHAVVPVSAARRSALVAKGVGPLTPVCTQSPAPMSERSERSGRPRPGLAGPGQAGLTPTSAPRDASDPRPAHVSGRLKRRTLQLLTLDRGRDGRPGPGPGGSVALGATLSGAGYGAVHFKAQAAASPVPPPRTERRSPSTSSSTSGTTADMHRGKQHRRVDAAPGLDNARVLGSASGSASASGSSPRTHAPLHTVHAAHRDSFHGAMCPALIVAQCFALLPVDGISRNHPGVPQFRWLSFRVFYTVAVFLGTAVVALLATYRMVSTGMSFSSSVTVVFFGNSLSAMVLFLQLATRWPAVARAWARIEHDMRTYGHPRHLGRKIKIMTAVVLALATVEHLLAVMTAVYTSWPCYESGGFPGLVRGYSINNFAMVLQVTEYTPWKAVFVFLLNVLATFSWNYTDLFIMLLSVSLAQRFKQLNHRLRALKGKNLPSGVWRQLRETYNSLACLTRTVDEAVNNIVLLSFASNLYFICVQLLQGMKLILDVYPYVYFFFSFGYLLLRTCVVSLYAASIHDESKEPRRVLYSVPSESFCTEVRRFLAQVTTDDVALTGCNFFSVTRSLMLTVAGTIVTYEIVLVQFQGVSGDGSTDSVAKAANITVRCQ